MTIQPLPQPHREIDVVRPVSQALEHVQRMLFQPFDLSKWIIVGFCAWLAWLGESGGAGFNYANNFNDQGNGKEQVRDFFHRVSLFVLANLDWIIPLASFLLVVLIALGLLVLWLNSRGKFMFLHCVALNRAEVETPWTRYAAQGNSLFWFRAVLGLVWSVVTLPLAVFFIIVFIQMLKNDSPDVTSILIAVGLGLGLLFAGLLFALVRKINTDFVVPLMYLRHAKCMAAWREFWRLLAGNPGRFALFFLFQIVLGIVISIIILAAVLITCCLACCLMAIPFIGTVLLLPVLVFKRAYSAFYLAQYGPEYDVFLATATTPVPPTPPTEGTIPTIGPLAT